MGNELYEALLPAYIPVKYRLIPLGAEQNGCHFADDISNILLNGI